MVYRLTAHLVLVTKRRSGAITDRVREALISTTAEVCARHGVTLLAAGGEHDHLHLLVDYPPKLSISTLVGAVKTSTSKRVREQQWPEITTALRGGEQFWSPSYFACSSGETPLELVAAYLRAQRVPNKAPGRPKVHQ